MRRNGQDVALLFRLPLEGLLVSGILDNEMWRDLAEQFCRIRLSEAAPGGATLVMLRNYVISFDEYVPLDGFMKKPC